MNIDFCSSHMDTLADLKAIAEKHNCKIIFGFTSDYEQDIDQELLLKKEFTQEFIDEMNCLMEITHSASTFHKVWFELFDKNANTYNTMAYMERSTFFTVKKEPIYSHDEQPSDKLIELLDKRDEMWDNDEYTINESDSPTVIYGFGNTERVEDYRCYRSGMALKFFGDLVCDYLKEPRIHRVY